MSYCVYDNPQTMRREYWIDGEVTAFITAELLIHMQKPENKEMFFGYKNIPFEKGKILEGDKRAMCNGMWWCESHKREATHIDETGRRSCDPKLGGILLPCHVVFVKS